MVTFSRRCHIFISCRDERSRFMVASRRIAATMRRGLRRSGTHKAFDGSSATIRFREQIRRASPRVPPNTARGGRGMQYGLFTMPSHPPERGLYEGHRWDLETLRWADELGFSEAWIGEHHTAPWEPHPAPDLLIAQALMETSRIRLAPGGFLLPYHHPAELANRVAMLDHMAQGRLNFGVAASGLPSDWAMFNVDGNAGQHREPAAPRAGPIGAWCAKSSSPTATQRRGGCRSGRRWAG